MARDIEDKKGQNVGEGIRLPLKNEDSINDAKKLSNKTFSRKLESFIDIMEYLPRHDARHGELINITGLMNELIGKLSDMGGGIIYIPPGKYLSGTIELKSNIEVILSKGATILFSPDEDDFLEGESFSYNPQADFETSIFRFSLFYANGASNITLSGGGVISGNGYPRGGPKPIALKSCKNISIKDIVIKEAPNYAISMIDCEDVWIEKVNIIDAFADGIDPDGCRRVHITGCSVQSRDDAICIKSSMSLGHLLESHDITISDCILRSTCNCFKIGTETSGPIRNITVNNCTLGPFISDFNNYTEDIIGDLKVKSDILLPSAAIAVESADGSIVENICIENIIINGCYSPIFIRLNSRLRGAKENPAVHGEISDVLISNVVVKNFGGPAIIHGSLHHPIGMVMIKNIIFDKHLSASKRLRELSIKMAGDKENGGSAGDAVPQETSDDSNGSFVRNYKIEIIEAENEYPTPEMFGKIPAVYFFIKHVGGSVLSDITFQIHSEFDLGDGNCGIYIEDSSVKISGSTLITEIHSESEMIDSIRNIPGFLIKGPDGALVLRD